MAIFVNASDLHIGSNRPQYRTDDYLESCLDKYQQIIDIANLYNADILCAGDIFSNVKIGYRVINNIIRITKTLKKKLYVVSGQHDRSYHNSDLYTSPFQTLLFFDNIYKLHNRSPIIVDDVHIYGCSWKEKPVDPGDYKSILVIHRSITPDTPPFFLTDALSATDALSKFNYDYIISGDYHKPFIHREGNRKVINCGPMMRQNIDETDLKPSVWLIDTNRNRVKRIFLTVKPAQEVFAFERIEQEKYEENLFTEELKDLVLTLKDTSKKPEFTNIVNMVISKINPHEAVTEKINDILERAKLIGVKK